MNYLIDRLAERVQDLIERKRFLNILSVTFAALAFIVRFLPMPAHRRRICDGRMYIACQQKNFEKAVKILVDLSKRETPGADSMRLFLYEVLGHVDPRYADELVKTPRFDRNLLPVIEAALLHRNGEYEAALSALDYTAKSFPVRIQVAEFKRSLLLEERRHEEFALDGVTRLSHDPDKPLFQFAASVAAAADSAGRNDILRSVIERIARDRDAILNDQKFLSRFAQQAVDASMWLLDLAGAKQVIDALRMSGMEKAAVRLERRLSLDALAPMSQLIELAHQDILARVGLGPAMAETRDAVIVIPSAALRSNKIDYPGFRADIRFVLQTIADCLNTMGLDYGVKGQIKLHGVEDLPMPFFSYHTVSRHRNGLHFKETDRPSRFSFDTGGYSGWSEFSRRSLAELPLHEVDATAAGRFFQQDQAQTISRNVSKYAQSPLHATQTLPARFVFVALQMMGDSVQDLAYCSPIEMMEEVVTTCERIGYSVVVKRHPLCGSTAIGKYIREKKDAGRIVVATGSIHTIIAQSAAVCVINSGVGAEALLHEKPVYVFGRSDYMAACFVCERRGDFEKQFQPGRTASSAEDLRRFWYLLRNEYAVDLRDTETAKAVIRMRVKQHISDFGENGSVTMKVS
ncbi:capsular polysaccharide export protein, LipB/KpsS family [Rhizobium mongolense]|uniref:capsular polysaccharide export protein, LipB/KpsS family n=1 Tax=Rhizobium mongolense TaxID=57676 RepID=UPI0034A32971